MTPIAYFDTPTGIAGDMAVGAMLDLGFPLEEIAARVKGLGVPGLEVSAEKVTRGGLAGTKYRVSVPGTDEHVHRGLREIRPMIARCGLSAAAEAIALGAFTRLATVEARLHATTPEEVHFHEVGAADALADIVGFATAYAGLGFAAGEAVASPLPLTRGRVEMAHGSIPIPAPATLGLLEGFTMEPSDLAGELVTPTGAALLATVARPENRLGTVVLRSAGSGAGSMEIPGRPNLLRVVSFDRAAAHGVREGGRSAEAATMIEANLDDMNPQLFGPLCERLLAAGALDVWTTPVQMKKGRPGVVLSMLCEGNAVDRLSAIVFSESTTIGLRTWPVDRRVLAREMLRVETAFGVVRVKVARDGDAVTNIAPEFEDARAVAEARGVAVKTVLAAAARAAEDALLKVEGGRR
jgi:uncharacterized protein (TIGR00299 family) protein